MLSDLSSLNMYSTVCINMLAPFAEQYLHIKNTEQNTVRGGNYFYFLSTLIVFCIICRVYFTEHCDDYASHHRNLRQLHWRKLHI